MAPSVCTLMDPSLKRSSQSLLASVLAVLLVLEEDSCAPSTAQELCDHDYVFCPQGGSRVPYSDAGFVCPDCGLLCDLEGYLCGENCEGCGVTMHWQLYDAEAEPAAAEPAAAAEDEAATEDEAEEPLVGSAFVKK